MKLCLYMLHNILHEYAKYNNFLSKTLGSRQLTVKLLSIHIDSHVGNVCI